MNLEKRRKNARVILDFLKDVLEKGYVILLRSNGTFGVVYHKEIVVMNGLKRELLYVVTQEGRDVREFADYYNGVRLESCVIIDFREAPFMLTARKRPSLSDDEEEFEWMLTGVTAEYYANLKNDYDRLLEHMRYLRSEIEARERRIQELEDRIKILSEENRDMQSVIERLNREVSLYRRELFAIHSMAEQAVADAALARSALNDIKNRIEQVGRWGLYGPDVMEAYMDKMIRLRDKYDLFYGTFTQPNQRAKKVEEEKKEEETTTPPS